MAIKMRYNQFRTKIAIIDTALIRKRNGIVKFLFIINALSDNIPQTTHPVTVRNTSGLIINESISLNCDKYRTERVPPQVRQGIWVNALKGQVKGN